MVTLAGLERDRLYQALRAELLGPRGGPREFLPLDQDPRDEYVTGILAPPRSSREIEGDERLSVLDPDESRPADETTEQDEELDDPAPAAGSTVSPTLDPRSLPSSLGLSFIVQGDDWSLGVLSTWARYSKEGNGWQRSPHFKEAELVAPDAEHESAIAAGVTLRIFTRSISADRRRVTIYLVNTAVASDHYRTEDLVFQPQLRVILLRGAELVPLSNSPGIEESSNESELAAWRDRLSYARGHLCSAVWRDVDYEAEKDAPAYHWIDAETVPTDIHERYAHPYVRTEYLPAYEVRNPDFRWPTGVPAPVLSASILADTFDPDALANALSPLVSAYRGWIQTNRDEIDGASPYAGADHASLDLCVEAADRLDTAIELLAANADVRLAFCFANKAIALQSAWHGGDIQWRPFQLAFILLNLPAISTPDHAERDICDLLYFPTGGGKTEAYLALMAFAMAYKRLALEDSGDGAGTTIISRYTLRLLTIQQFRRTTRLVTACEYLRVVPNQANGIGWIPEGLQLDGVIWGGSRFSIGLWVGGGVTPNGLVGFNARSADRQMLRFLGAIDQLKGARIGYSGPDLGLAAALNGIRRLEGSEAEPAQLLECPACSGMLAIPEPAMTEGTHDLHFVVRSPGQTTAPTPASIESSSISIQATSVSAMSGGSPDFKILSMTALIREDVTVRAIDLDQWFYDKVLPKLGANARLECARPSRMGYFIDSRSAPLNKVTDGDFAIFCPNPECPLQITSRERVPLSEGQGDASRYQVVIPPFRSADDPAQAVRLPISAFTVDEQIYRRVPSIVIATVDKFARLTDDPAAASLFGNVDHYHARLGYYREGSPAWVGEPPSTAQAHPPDARGSRNQRVGVAPLHPPSLVVQDELHLIDGPLGSMVGAFETISDALTRAARDGAHRLKYIASTATVSQAEAQIQSIFDRRLRVFPPRGRVAHENFFLATAEGHPSDNANGRLYVGIAAIGRGPQTPMVRIWSRALQQVGVDRTAGVPEAECDPYWTVVGYFNAIRELAAGRALLRADIPQRMDPAGRQLLRDTVELSGRTSSLELPRVLDQLGWQLPRLDTVDALVTTSMFGTGIDIPRLGLMIVHGQPKTTSAYIQATGRVGRTSPALVLTFLRASRPRDLDHYEFFIGYHRAMGRWVEPVTVAPFASRTCERVLGPIQVALLRQAREISGQPVTAPWHIEQRLSGGRFNSSARLMTTERASGVMASLASLLEARAASQPATRRPPAGYVLATAGNELDRWRLLAQLHDNPDELVYREPAVTRPPSRAVVLGDPHHREADLDRVYEDAPTSLREVEGTIGVFIP